MYFYPMQVYANSNRLSLKTIFFFVAVVLIAFLPISSFLFFLKNDAFVGYFPPKFFMSESIHAGYLPLWNPYINFGFPQYGDMSGGFWSPVTWLMASTVGYNAYTLTIEVLLYILLGGIGMYQLTDAWQLDKKVRIIAGIAFMCCGYNVGHLQHFNWLSGAAFLPWCFWSYLLLLNHFSLKHTIRTVLLFYLLAVSAHPGIIISSFYFFLGVLVFHFFKNDKRISVKDRIKQLSLSHGILLVLFLLLSAGMITGYLDILPFFVRGEKISLSDSLSNPTNLQSWISALLPFATVKNDAFYNTDPTMRNSYFSLVLLLFFLQACTNKKNSWQKFLLVTGFLFALLSAGGIFKTFAYKFIPLIGYVRLNGEFRIFTLLAFIIIAAIELDKFIKQKNTFSGTIKWNYYLIEIILINCIIVSLYNVIHSKLSLLYGLNNILVQHTITLKLKILIDAVSFYDTFWIQGIIQLFLWWGIKWCLRFGNMNLLKQIVVADMIIACLLNIPFTGVGKASVAAVQTILNKSPKGIPIPILQPIKNIDSLPREESTMIGDWSMYNKQIGVKEEVPYPIVLKNMNAYFENNISNSHNNFLNEPFIFIEGAKDKNNVVIQSFSPNQIAITVTADSSTQLVLQQNFYPHWFYQNGANKKAVNHAGINFMSAPVNKGVNNIVFSFEPTAVKWAMLLSAILFVIYCLLLFIPTSKRPSPS
jgi:hypothetical protein